jgi:hypothetical protein
VAVGPAGLAPPEVGSPRQPERHARRRDAEPRPDLRHRRHHDGLGPAAPPARPPAFLHLDQGLRTLSARAPSCGLPLELDNLLVPWIGNLRDGAALPREPRQLPAIASRAPRSPSGRSTGPPGAAGRPQLRVSYTPPRTILRLYSRVNRRLVAFATTSISGPARARSAVLPGGHCLTHIGREGGRAVRRHEV